MKITLITIAVFLALFIAYGTYKAPRLTGIIWWALVASITSTAALIIITPGPVRDRLLWFGFFMPILWVLLQMWCYWETKHWRINTVLISLSLFGGAIITLADPVI